MSIKLELLDYLSFYIENNYGLKEYLKNKPSAGMDFNTLKNKFVSFVRKLLSNFNLKNR